MLTNVDSGSTQINAVTRIDSMVLLGVSNRQTFTNHQVKLMYLGPAYLHAFLTNKVRLRSVLLLALKPNSILRPTGLGFVLVAFRRASRSWVRFGVRGKKCGPAKT